MSYLPPGGGRPSYGVEAGGAVIDVVRAITAFGLSQEPPRTLLELVRAGNEGTRLAVEAVRRWEGAGQAGLPDGVACPRSDVSFLPPLGNPSKMIAVGRNYADHVRELSVKQPLFPKLFAKYPSNAVGHLAEVIRPGLTKCLDYEAELAFVIGAPARNVTREDAMSHIFGYTVANDLCARDIQFRDEQVTLAKNFRTFAPMGPYLVTADAVDDPGDLDIRLWVNGCLRQDSNTRNLVFDIPHLVSFISSVMDLEAGDVVLTGTPAGVGYGLDPPAFLEPGDVVRIEVEQVGVLENPIRS